MGVVYAKPAQNLHGLTPLTGHGRFLGDSGFEDLVDKPSALAGQTC